MSLSVYLSRVQLTGVFDTSITHNLSEIADAAGIYLHLWRPEDIGITLAAQLIQPLTEAVELLKSDPKRFQELNAPNGWSVYTDFLPWVEKYLAACKKYPDAIIEAER